MILELKMTREISPKLSHPSELRHKSLFLDMQILINFFSNRDNYTCFLLLVLFPIEPPKPELRTKAQQIISSHLGTNCGIRFLQSCRLHLSRYGHSRPDCSPYHRECFEKLCGGNHPVVVL